MPMPRANILGVGISAATIDLAVANIDHWIAERTPTYVCITSVHGVIESQHDPSFRKIINHSGMSTPDGMPLVWLSRAHGFSHVQRVYGPDLMLAVCEFGLQRGYRHFFYGGLPGVAELLIEKLTARFPGLIACGSYCPPFRPLTEDEEADLQRQVDAARPDLFWVGLSTPKQERFMAEHCGRLNVPVLLGVGAAFDFHSGRKQQAPRWMQRSSLEWLFRLLTEPRRLAKRYLINNPLFLALVFAQAVGLKRYTLEDTGK